MSVFGHGECLDNDYPWPFDCRMNTCRFTLCLTVDQYQQYYKGTISSIVARSEEGIRVAFPASRLRQFVTRHGVQGRFEIVFDNNHRLVSLRRVS